MAPQLLDFAPEVLHNIFQHAHATDLGRLSRCCHLLNNFIKSDILLWKIQYLKDFDYPASSMLIDRDDKYWKTRLSEVVGFQKVLESTNDDLKRDSLNKVASMAVDLIADSPSGTSPSLNTAFLSRLMALPGNVSHFMSRSSLFKHAGDVSISPASTPADRQLSARLHVLYGMSIEPSKLTLELKLARPVHPFARSRVYDLRRYTDHNFWGPFLDDGSGGIDWEKLQAIMVVLGYNLHLLHERTDGEFSLVWDRPFAGLASDSLISRSLDFPMPKQPKLDLDLEDPYGVTGTWMRVVCFLDYNNLYQFNFDSEDVAPDQDREPICTEEAVRLIFLKLVVSKIEPPGEDDAQDMPVVHFKGSSRSMHMSWDPNANSKIRGTVRTTPSGATRWTTFSIYHGDERWRSEGVQIGGRRSARGVLGTWFDKDFDVHGPAGPSSFWKLSDDVVGERSAQIYPYPFSAFS